MSCQDVDRWLDEGSPVAGRAEAMLHVRICARCAAALTAAEDLDLALAVAPPAPIGFTDRVMARVAETAQARAGIPVLEVLPLLRTFPWWVRLALEPASLLATLLAAVLIWRGNTLFALAASGAAQLATWLAQVPSPWAALGLPAATGGTEVATVLLRPTVFACVALGAAPLLFMASRLLYGWSATLVGPRPLHLRLH